MEPASLTCGAERPNVIHFPKRDFVSFSHLAFNGLVTGVDGVAELCDVGLVENRETWNAQKRVEVWRSLEQGIRGGILS
jgi:hypothetical protein